MSVIVPVYNQAEFVIAAIDSVLDQGYPAVELIVVDDGSTDATAELVAGHRTGSFRTISQANRGAAAALNRGVRECHGELVCWLSADDLFMPDKITRQVEALAKDPRVGLVYTGFERISAGGGFIASLPSSVQVHPDPFVAVFWQNSINGSSVMVRREVFETCGEFDESLRADVDADMWLRITQKYKAQHIDGVYLKYRIHQNTLSANVPLMIRSKTDVRLRYLRSGALASRLATFGEPRPARLLAWMGADFAQQGLSDLAAEMLRESRRTGQDRVAQSIAAVSIRLTEIARRSRPSAVLTRPLRGALDRARLAVDSRA